MGWIFSDLLSADVSGADQIPGAGPTDVSEWARANLGFDADATQARALNSKSRRMLLNCTRQWGKSTVTAARAVHQAYTAPGSLTLVMSPSARQSAEFVRKAEEFLRRLEIR